MRFLRRAIAVGVFSPSLIMVLLGACTLAIDTDDLANGQPATTDAAQPLDGVGPDGSGSDAVVGADSFPPGTRFCQQHIASAFCSDFEDGLLQRGWTDKEQTEGTIVLGPGPTTPFAMVTDVPAAVAPDGKSARLYRDFLNVPPSLHIEVDMRLCAQSFGEHEFLKLEQVSPLADDAGYLGEAVEMVMAGGSFEVVIEGNNEADVKYNNKYPGSSNPKIGAWTHVTMDIVLSTTLSGSMSLAFDGVPAIDMKGIRTLTRSATGLRLIVGTYLDETNNSCSDAFDNVLVEMP